MMYDRNDRKEYELIELIDFFKLEGVCGPEPPFHILLISRIIPRCDELLRQWIYAARVAIDQRIIQSLEPVASCGEHVRQ